MKRKIILIYALILLLANNVEVKASDYASDWLAKKQAEQEKYLSELEKDGNLTQEAIDATKLKTNKKSNNKEKENKNKEKSKTIIVYGTDELHIVGLPENEKGYTKAGKYEIE